MKPVDIIPEVRNLIQDTKTPYRYSDMVLLGFINQILKRMAILRPDLFARIDEFATVPGSVIQSCPLDSIRLIDIFQVKNGNAVVEVDKETLDRTYPYWMMEASGVPVNFMRHVKNPNRYFLYPRPAAGVILIGEYARFPRNYALNDNIEFPIDAYFPIVVDGVVFLAQSIDNEHVNSGRAKLFYDSFIQALGVGLQSRVITDTPSAGLDPREVI